MEIDPAAKAGLREHDVILEFNGTAVESEEQLRRLIRKSRPDAPWRWASAVMATPRDQRFNSLIIAR